jgi:hypothetical protein
VTADLDVLARAAYTPPARRAGRADCEKLASTLPEGRIEMRLSSLWPTTAVRRLKYLRRCLELRGDLEPLCDDLDFIRQCVCRHDDLKLFFQSRLALRSVTLNEGTLLYDVERELLKELVERCNALDGPIIEIGTLFGFTTSKMAVWKAPHKKILTVDNYSGNAWLVDPQMHRALTRQFLHYLLETGHVELFDMDKNEFFAGYRGEPPALVFLDADHTYEPTRGDIAWARRAGARIIAGHDYSHAFQGVGRAVEEAGGTARLAGGVWVLDNEYWKSQRPVAA